MPLTVPGPLRRHEESVHVTRRALLATGQFRRAVSAQFISQTFDAACTVLLAKIFFFGSADGPAISQVMTAAATASIPLFLGGPLSAFLVDRCDRRMLLVAGQSSRAAVTILYVALVVTDSGHLVYGATALSLCAGRVMYTARVASVRHLVRQHELVAADSLMLTISTLSGSAGAILGGAAYLVFGAGGFLVAMAGHLLGATAYARLTVPLGSGRERVPATSRQVAISLLRPKIRYAILATSTHRVAVGVVLGSTVVSTAVLPGPPEAHYGVAVGAGALGAFIATFPAEWLNERLKRRAVSLLTFGSASAAAAATALAGSPPAAVVCLFILGLSFQTLRVSADATVQKNAPRGSGGRVFTAYDTAYGVMFLAGIMAGAALARHLSTTTVLTACALWYGTGAVLFAVMPRTEPTDAGQMRATTETAVIELAADNPTAA